MPDTARLAELDRALRHRISRLEAPRKARKPGHRGDHVAGRFATRLAFPAWVVWTAVLSQRKPTHASLERAAHKLRGHVLYRLALRRHAAGEALPVRDGHTPPPWALRPMHERMATVTRAAEDEDPADWWDLYGDAAGLSLDEFGNLVPDIGQDIRGGALQDVTESLAFDNWLSGLLSDLQVLQILQGHWNGQASLWAGQEAAAGISGSFDFIDQNMTDFLFYAAGQKIVGIDQTTRNQIRDALWKGFGGLYEQGVNPISPQAIGRNIRTILEPGYADLKALDPDYARKIAARANRIAVTEIARAESFGSLMSYLQNGVRWKEWMISEGACAICETNQSMGAIRINDRFPNGSLAPPAHPLCRCSLAPASSPDAKGFDPNDWADELDQGALMGWLSDPAVAANFPDVDMPNLTMPYTPQGAGKIADFGLLNFGDLPPALQAVLDPLALSDLEQHYGQVADDAAAEYAASTGKDVTTLAPEEYYWLALDAPIDVNGLRDSIQSLDQVIQYLMDHGELPPGAPQG